MLTETGRVVAIDQHHLWVETINRAACGSCAAQKGCGQSLLARWASKSAFLRVPLDGRNPDDFAINDSLLLGIPEDLVVRTSLLIYCLPLVLMLTGGAIGQQLAGEGGAIAGALAGLLTGGGVVSVCTKAMQRKRRLDPVVLELLPGVAAPA
ncbi:SoxR reducing system RseC family protein [Gilvimarinus sp. F26214L]|uniref:SoxR reducing system RseC family protein n=1 Tax=Gilvimarinus sp. DZF01 TaxID=3461371 RepID=UPI004045ED95